MPEDTSINTSSKSILLSAKITKLADIDYVGSVAENDLLLAAQKPSSSDPIKSYKLQLSSVGEYTLDGLEAKDPFAPLGQWNFRGSNTMINIPLSAVNLSTDVPNIEYAYKTLIAELDKLSAQLYSDDPEELLLPSYVGMVVIGDDTLNEKMMADIYGANTTWQRIKGRFILGAGAPGSGNSTGIYGSNTRGTNVPAKKYGGAKSVSLKGIPGHTHRFEDANYGKFPNCDDIEIEVKTIGIFDKTKKLREPAGAFHYSNSWGRKAVQTAVGCDKTNLPPAKTVEADFEFTAKGKILKNSGTNSAHFNIPPYYGTCIWERIK